MSVSDQKDLKNDELLFCPVLSPAFLNSILLSESPIWQMAQRRGEQVRSASSFQGLIQLRLSAWSRLQQRFKKGIGFHVAWKKTMLMRGMKENEKDILKDFLYEAIFIPEGVDPPDRSIIEQPELRIYYEDFGTGRADHCIVADDNGKVIGAVWTRIMNDYGHVDDETPSFAISLYKEYRGQGIGTRMMNEMLALLKEKGYKQASLAVQKANYAVRMYEKVGFKTVDENAEEYIMVCEL